MTAYSLVAKNSGRWQNGNIAATKVLGQVRKALRGALPELQRSYEVPSLAVFGSIAREDAGAGSDIDILVRFRGEPPGLFQFVRLERRLSEVLGRPVDLVMEAVLKPRLREKILAEAVTAAKINNNNLFMDLLFLEGNFGAGNKGHSSLL